MVDIINEICKTG